MIRLATASVQGHLACSVAAGAQPIASTWAISQPCPRDGRGYNLPCDRAKRWRETPGNAPGKTLRPAPDPRQRGHHHLCPGLVHLPGSSATSRAYFTSGRPGRSHTSLPSGGRARHHTVRAVRFSRSGAETASSSSGRSPRSRRPEWSPARRAGRRLRRQGRDGLRIIRAGGKPGAGHTSWTRSLRAP